MRWLPQSKDAVIERENANRINPARWSCGIIGGRLLLGIDTSLRATARPGGQQNARRAMGEHGADEIGGLRGGCMGVHAARADVRDAIWPACGPSPPRVLSGGN